MNSSNVTPAKRCQHGSTFETYNYHLWFSKSPKRLKKIQWVGQPNSVFSMTVMPGALSESLAEPEILRPVSSKAMRDPEVRAANWLVDSVTHDSDTIARQAASPESCIHPWHSRHGRGSWTELTGDSRVDWREQWAKWLERYPQFAWWLIHVGPEGLYKAANLSEGECEVMRLKQEGHTQEQVAFLTGKSLGLVQNALSRGYAKVAGLAGVERPKRKRRLANSHQLPIEDPLTLAA